MHRSLPPVPGPHQSVTGGDYDIPGSLTQHSSLHCSFCRRNRIEEPPTVRLQTSSSGDAPGATALTSNFLGNAASSSNICTGASQTLVHGSVTIHDKVIMGPHRNEKIRTMQQLLIQLNVFNVKDGPLFCPLFPTFV